MTIDEYELLPCPFCGGPAHCGQDPEALECNYAGCADPGCVGYNPAYDFVTLTFAIAAWNRRKDGLGTVSVKPTWQTMDTAPKDGTRFVALEHWPSGQVYALTYRWEGPPNYWNAERGGVCIRPEYQERYLWTSLPDFETRVKSCLTSIGAEAGK